MRNKQLKEKVIKIVAVYLALNLLAEFIMPVAAYALTNGPSQPEVDSFEPVNTNQMVDLFSGDFTYNIPLFTVPGPNGGYPINLAYHAGIGMEQEASWVGLGWNINPGAITRTMRGLPDDFSGEKVKKTLSIKPNITAGFSISSLTVPNDVELFGFNATMQSKTFQVRYNSYKGLGFKYNRTRNFKNESKSYVASRSFERLMVSNGFDFDSQNGTGIQPSIFYDRFRAGHSRTIYKSFACSMSYHSRSGVTDLSLSVNRKKGRSLFSSDNYFKHGAKRNFLKKASFLTRGAGVSFSAGDFVPQATNSYAGFSASGFFKGGAALAGTHYSKAKEIFFSLEGLLDKTHDYPAYGYQYLENRTGAEDDAMMDFNRQAEFAITPDAPSLPVPVMTNDVYMVAAQGMGMVFRPYRSDYGAVYDPKSTSDFGSARIGNEPGGQHSGFNLAASYTHNYSGQWKDQWDELDGTYEFGGGNGLSEPFYFKATGEQVADDDAYGEIERFGGETATDFRIAMKFDGTLSWEPEVFNDKPHSNSDILTYNLRNTRARRSQNIEYRTRAQITGDPNYGNRGKYLFSENVYPNAQNSGTQFDYSDTYGSTINSSQNGEISVLNAEGNRYVYGIPVYNISEKDVFFSVDKPGAFSRTILYDATQASVNNNSGSDHLYSCTEMPPYAYAYLLTAIFSPDYVDVTGNGPSDDDLGYYVKFNYSQTPDYNWRTPFINADYDQGFHSNDYDDKAAYRYGTRENYFLNSIETKTHVAEFHTSDRKDGRGAYIEENTTNQGTNFGEDLRKLDEIKLFSKSDRVTPIKTVHFKYSYDLCPNVVNNDGTADASVIGNNVKKGKLTLKEVWFTYKGNEKGSLSPYKFYYREDDTQYNPDYNLLQMDCWGNYKPDDLLITGTARNEEFPYVSQKQDEQEDVDKYMAAWNLHQITLPSGGLMTIDYESDDYAYVQDKQAMQMCNILFTGTDNDGTTRNTASHELGETGNEVKNRIYFELPTPASTTNQSEILKYIDGISNLYFRTYMKLPKADNTGMYLHSSYDYVEGYCKINSSLCGIDDQSGSPLGYTRGYISVVPVSVSSLNLGLVTVHPFRKATWEYLRMHREDLLYPGHPITDDDLLSLNAFESVLSLFNDFSSMLLGYYNACLVKGFSKEMNLTDEHPSVIRLNSPQKAKNGGGHRVKQITISDGWDVLTGSQEDPFSYGQEYMYNKVDGSSYGVAEYEPLIGGAENPLHQPTDKFSSTRRMLINDKNFYMEFPLCESYYPGANVGYSKVIVRNLKRYDPQDPDQEDINKKTASGFAVTEFYTAKDFPVREYPTEVQHKQYNPIGIFIPFIGQQEFDNNGYSQGYSVELNDMHGKVKAISSYAYNADYHDPDKAVTRTEFIYNTVSPYNPEAPNRLFNLVTVLDGDAQTRMAAIGQQTEFFYDMDQHSSTSIQLGLQTNVDQLAVGPFVPSLIPSINYSFNMFRSIVAMKVTTKTGVLVETRTRNQSAMAIEKNLMFDSHTGIPLLTSVTNDFDAPVYTYNYPAHWSYDGMDQAALNYGFHCGSEGTVNSNYFLFNTSSGFDDENLTSYFSVGDKVLLTVGTASPEYYWVKQFNPTGYGVQFMEEDGIVLSSGTINSIQVVRSGRTNQNVINNGVIVSLRNPVTEERNFPLFTAVNTALENSPTVPPMVSFVDCASEETKTAYIEVGSNYVKFSDLSTCDPRCDCEGIVTADPAVIALGVTYLTFHKRGNSVLIKYANGATHSEHWGTWSDYNHCYPECMDDVLHAEAYRFTDQWSYDYGDAGVAPSSPIISNAANGFRCGTRGIWRNESSYAFQVNRKQQAPNTNIAKDGTYENFVFFHWDPSNTHNSTNYDNPEWTFVSSETKYSPYGFNLEARNALNIYSNAGYGYTNSASTWVAANATYYETAFDGFEDYPSNIYTAPSIPPVPGHGHLTLTAASAAPVLKTDKVHTGGVSMDLSTQVDYNNIPVVSANPSNGNIPNAPQTAFSFIAGKKYTITAWVYSGATGATPVVSVTNGVNVTTTIMPQKIEGWQHIETTFQAPTTGTVSIHYSYNGGNGSERVDDIRIQPFQSSMKSYVYDPVTLWLVATLDDRNFATFYNYDEEGKLVQVKMETERGIFTAKTSRDNIHH